MTVTNGHSRSLRRGDAPQEWQYHLFRSLLFALPGEPLHADGLTADRVVQWLRSSAPPGFSPRSRLELGVVQSI